MDLHPTQVNWVRTVMAGNDEDSHSEGLVGIDEAGRTHDGTLDGPDHHYCFGEPVLAPADGLVVAMQDDHPDHDRTDGWLDLSPRDNRGNYVTIRHAVEEYSVLAHLEQGSVTVDEGHRVQRGEQIGRCGHSGNSTEPHLHFQLQDGPDFFHSMGLPIRFDDVTTRLPDADGEFHERAYVHAGQRVEHTPRTSTVTRPAGEEG